MSFDRSRSFYLECGFPVDLVDAVESLSDEERKSWYFVVSAAVAGNDNAIAMFQQKFGAAKTMLSYHSVSTMCFDSFSESESYSIAMKATRGLDALASMQGVSPATAEAMSVKAADESFPRLLMYRMQKGLTQKELSKLSGVNVMQISRIERGDIKIRNVSLANASALANALGVSPDDLL